jgi:hypothetical protein
MMFQTLLFHWGTSQPLTQMGSGEDPPAFVITRKGPFGVSSGAVATVAGAGKVADKYPKFGGAGRLASRRGNRHKCNRGARSERNQVEYSIAIRGAAVPRQGNQLPEAETHAIVSHATYDLHTLWRSDRQTDKDHLKG